MNYIAKRLKEPSTWAALGAIASALGPVAGLTAIATAKVVGVIASLGVVIAERPSTSV